MPGHSSDAPRHLTVVPGPLDQPTEHASAVGRVDVGGQGAQLAGAGEELNSGMVGQVGWRAVGGAQPSPVGGGQPKCRTASRVGTRSCTAGPVLVRP